MEFRHAVTRMFIIDNIRPIFLFIMQFTMTYNGMGMLSLGKTLKAD